MLKTTSATLSGTREDYRPDIDGLRADFGSGRRLLPLQIPYISGGFVGVDVFFVISGYLITSHLFRDIERNGLSDPLLLRPPLSAASFRHSSHHC